MFIKIEIPENVEVEVAGSKITVKGPRGIISKDFDNPRFNIQIEKGMNEILIKYDSEKRKVKAMVGTIKSHIKNMMSGVTTGFRYKMKIFYTHFPISVVVKDDKVMIKNFLGEKHERIANIIGDTEIKVERDEIILSGSNIEDVGQTAANIELACKLSKRDRRIFQDGCYIIGRV